MDCREVQDWLLRADDLRSESCGSADADEHLEGCVDCRTLRGRLMALEQAWRELPLPGQSDLAKAAFLARLPKLTAAAFPLGRHSSAHRLLRWVAAIAASLLIVGVGVWVFHGGQEAQASDDLLDELLDWNLRLTQAQSPDERSEVYARKAELLRSAIDKARLPREQADVAKTLLENGQWLARHQDPAIAAERFDGLAGRLLELAREAGEKGNHKRMNSLLRQYSLVVRSGVDPNVAIAEASGALDLENQRRLEKLALRDAEHVRELASLLEKAPDASRKEIAQALGAHDKKRKKPHPGKQKPRVPNSSMPPPGSR
jgi:hypothetical protein